MNKFQTKALKQGFSIASLIHTYRDRITTITQNLDLNNMNNEYQVAQNNTWELRLTSFSWLRG